jgi:DUF1009 family protein
MMRIAIIAGGGNLPLYLAEKNKDIFVLCISEYVSSKCFHNKSSEVSILDPEKWVYELNNNNITHVVMVGKIDRPKVENNLINKNAILLLNKINDLGDNSALLIIEKFFEENDIKILPISKILKDCYFDKGFSKNTIFSKENRDLIIESSDFGIKLLNSLSPFDVGQSLVVSKKFVYAIEGPEGTNEMIKRAGYLYSKLSNNKFGPVLIKIPKTSQNTYLDPPILGVETLEICLNFGFSSLVVSSKGTIIVDREAVENFLLETQNICIYSV